MPLRWLPAVRSICTLAPKGSASTWHSRYRSRTQRVRSSLPPTAGAARPIAQYVLQRLTLGFIDPFTALPCTGISDADPNVGLDTIPKLIRVERINFPATVTVFLDVPLVARVGALIGCGE